MPVPHPESTVRRARQLAECGTRQAEAGEILGVSLRTLRSWKITWPGSPGMPRHGSRETGHAGTERPVDEPVDEPEDEGHAGGELPLARDWDLGWLARAACAGVNVELFYERAQAPVARAKLFCQACGVREECLRAAMGEERALGRTAAQNRERRFGVRGGLSAGERWRLAYPKLAAEQREQKEAARRARQDASPPPGPAGGEAL